MAEPEAKPAETPAKKKPPIKLIGIVAGIMIAEAAGVFFIVGGTGHKPEKADAKELRGGDHADLEKPVELSLVDDKFQNMSSGKAWMWDISMYLQVKKKNEDSVKESLKTREAEIKEGVSMIFRKATLNQLKEPGLETLNRQILAFVNRIIQPDPEGVARVDRILIPKCRGFVID